MGRSFITTPILPLKFVKVLFFFIIYATVSPSRMIVPVLNHVICFPPCG